MCIEISKYKWKFPIEWSFKNPASNQPVVLIHQILMTFAWTQSSVGSNKRSCRVPVIIKLTAWREAETLRYTPWREMHVNNLQSVGALGAFSRVLKTSENLEWTCLDWVIARMEVAVNNIAVNVPAVSLLLCSIFSNSFINCQNQNQNQQNQCEVN